MTLPTEPPISMQDIATELGRNPPISFSDPDVLALAGKTTGPLSMSDFLGKSAFTYKTFVPGGGSVFILSEDLQSMITHRATSFSPSTIIPPNSAYMATGKYGHYLALNSNNSMRYLVQFDADTGQELKSVTASNCHSLTILEDKTLLFNNNTTVFRYSSDLFQLQSWTINASETVNNILGTGIINGYLYYSVVYCSGSNRSLLINHGTGGFGSAGYEIEIASGSINGNSLLVVPFEEDGGFFIVLVGPNSSLIMQSWVVGAADDLVLAGSVTITNYTSTDGFLGGRGLSITQDRANSRVYLVYDNSDFSNTNTALIALSFNDSTKALSYVAHREDTGIDTRGVFVDKAGAVRTIVPLTKKAEKLHPVSLDFTSGQSVTLPASISYQGYPVRKIKK